MCIKQNKKKSCIISIRIYLVDQGVCRCSLLSQLQVARDRSDTAGEVKRNMASLWFPGSLGSYPIGCCHPMWPWRHSWVRQSPSKTLAHILCVGGVGMDHPSNRDRISGSVRFQKSRERAGTHCSSWKTPRLGTDRPDYILSLETDTVGASETCYPVLCNILWVHSIA